jgi:hypothetical protein
MKSHAKTKKNKPSKKKIKPRRRRKKTEAN